MKKILVIEDEKDTRDTITYILKKKGADVSVTDNVKDAEKLIRTGTWDAIICDVMLPHLGGFELADVAKEVSKTPVILVTGLEKEILHSTKNAADIVITKPFSANDILSSVQRAGVQL